MDIIGGTPNLSDEDMPAGSGHRIHVKKAYRHPDFVRKELWHDVAVLQLAEPIPTDGSMRVITRANSSHPALRTGDMLTVVGWGDTDPSKINAYPYNLMRTEVPALTDAECDSILRMAGYGTLDHTEKHCAGGENRDTCQGDSGGPAFRNGILYGTVSWGASCHGHLPAVYSDTIAYEAFINDAMKGIEWSKGAGLTNSPDREREERGITAELVSSDVSNGENGELGDQPWHKRHFGAFVTICVLGGVAAVGSLMWMWCYCTKSAYSDSESWTGGEKMQEPLYARDVSPANPQQDQLGSSGDDEKESAPLQKV